jgi:uncharacterized protein DUF2845
MNKSSLCRSAFLSGAVLLVPVEAGAETFRCGKWLISAEVTLTELVDKCGSPTSRESKTEDVRVRNQNNGLMVKVGETTTERWTFDRGSQAAPMVVVIVDGQIKSIERLRK